MGTVKISVPTLLVFHSAQGGVSAQLLFLIKFCKLICVLLCVMPSHILYRRPATGVPSSVPGSYGKPASGTARSLLVGDVLELVTEDAGGASGSRALVTVHRVAEHGSMGTPSSAHGNEANQNQWMCGRVACSAAAKAQTEATYTCAQRATPIATSATTTCTAWNGAWFRAGKSIRPG